MMAFVLMALLAGDGSQSVRMVTGEVVAVDRDSFTVETSKGRQTFKPPRGTSVVAGGTPASVEKISVGDTVTVTSDGKSGVVTEVRVVFTKAAARRKTGDKARGNVSAERVRVNDLGAGAFGFGPFPTDFGAMDVKAKVGQKHQVEVTVTIADPPSRPNFKGKKSGALKLAAGPELRVARREVHGTAKGGTEAASVASTGKPQKGKAGTASGKGGEKASKVPGNQPAGGTFSSSSSLSHSFSLQFLVPHEADLKEGDPVEIHFGDWRLVFDGAHDPAVAAAFRELLQKVRGG